MPKGQWMDESGIGTWGSRQNAGDSHTRLAIRMTTAAGGSAGNITVTGVEVGDHLISVINLADGLDLTAQFTITATDVINNTGGDATTSDRLLVLYQK